MTERTNAGFFATLATFPDQPQDLEADLIGFALRLDPDCICSRDGKFLRRLIQNEGERYPELFAAWREHGPGRTWAAIAARFARLAHAGYLDDRGSRPRRAPVPGLVNAERRRRSCWAARRPMPRSGPLVTNAVGTFLRAFGPDSAKPARRGSSRGESTPPDLRKRSRRTAVAMS